MNLTALLNFKKQALFLVYFLALTVLSYSQLNQNSRPKIGVVLSGGGAKGLAHIGVLKELEKAGIPIDYIAGTSMGAIVGGLYAIGYTPGQLDTLTRLVDWDVLLSDKVSRNHLSMVEKDEDVKYMLSFPIRKKKIVLPMGIVSGQNISVFFSKFCAPVYYENDFSKFQVPFFCMAADVANAKAIELNRGDLAQAMRASMAIPTVFTPEEISGKMLLDGGIINNFPVQEMRDKGADIIIGVDVAFDSATIEMNSIVKVITQSMLMYSRERSMESRKKCDIIILPDLDEYSPASFNRADSLIYRGEKAVIKSIESINRLAKMLKDSFQFEYKPRPRVNATDVFFIDEIEISGLKEIPENFLLRKMPFTVPSGVRLDDIEKFISNMYGTRFFERVTYKLEPGAKGLKLKFNVIERSTNYFRAGFHYDNDFGATLLLNATFRNKISKGSKISLDLALGENPTFSALYYKNSGWNPRNNILFWSKIVPDYGFQFQFHNIEVYDFVKDTKVASLGFIDVTADFFIQGNLSNSNAYGISLRGDYTKVSDRIALSSQYQQKSLYFNAQVYYKIDSYNEAFFPSKGTKLFAEAKYVQGLSEKVRNSKGFTQASLRANCIQPLNKQLSISEGIYAGTLLTDTAPSQYWYYMGGMGASNYRGSMQFVGLEFMQRVGNHLLVYRSDIQWEMWNDNFLTIKSNIGKAVRVRKNLFVPEDILVGYGISYGYRSPIGPMELTLMSSNRNPGLSVYVSIGYSF